MAEAGIYLGLIAGALTTVAFVPQVLQAYRTRGTKDLSLKMLAILWAGLFCWLLYGLSIGNLPIVLANLITLALASCLLIMKLRYG